MGIECVAPLEFEPIMPQALPYRFSSSALGELRETNRDSILTPIQSLEVDLEPVLLGDDDPLSNLNALGRMAHLSALRLAKLTHWPEDETGFETSGTKLYSYFQDIESKLPSLRTLVFDCNEFAGSLHFLQHFRHLSSLSVTAAPPDEDLLDPIPISSFPNLTQLHLDFGLPVSIDVTSSALQIPTLRCLNLSVQSLLPAHLEALRLHPSLEALALNWYPNDTFSGPSLIESLPSRLRRLRLTGGFFFDAPAALERLQNLESLILSLDNGVFPDALLLPCLTELSIRPVVDERLLLDTLIQQRDLLTLPAVSSLRKLTLNPEFQPNDATIFASFKSLTSLELNRCGRVPTDLFASLWPLPLVSLTIKPDRVSDDVLPRGTLKGLTQCTSLKEFHCDPHISAYDAMEVLSSSSLTACTISVLPSSKAEDAAFESFLSDSKASPSSSPLRSLTIHSLPYASYPKWLRRCHNLKSLELRALHIESTVQELFPWIKAKCKFSPRLSAFIVSEPAMIALRDQLPQLEKYQIFMSSDDEYGRIQVEKTRACEWPSQIRPIHRSQPWWHRVSMGHVWMQLTLVALYWAQKQFHEEAPWLGTLFGVCGAIYICLTGVDVYKNP